MCVGYLQILCHFIKDPGVSLGFGTFGGSCSQSFVDSEGRQQ